MRVINLFIIASTIFCFCGVSSVHAQNKEAVVEAFRDLQKLYSGRAGLSFSIGYSYSNETKPEVILDSLSGEMLLVESGYRYRIAKTETIRNNKYTIIMFEDDSLMHISTTRGSLDNNLNPTGMIDSNILNVPGTTFGVRTIDNVKEITLLFPINGPYKSIQLFIDVTTGFVQKTTMVFKTSIMADIADETTKIPGYDEYAIVETTFRNYRSVDVGAAELNEQKFFTKSGKELIPTGRYKNYKIFIGSPNL